MEIGSENILLIGSIMLFIGIFAGKAGYKYGVPSLLLFLIVGMIMGCDGLGVKFESYSTSQFIGVMALSVILFSGGMDTRFGEIKPVLKQGIILASLGVIFTAIFTGAFIYYVAKLFTLELTFAQSLLMASVMSSTDSASVFSILRSKNLSLKENLRPLLELESGSNDPMAYMLTMACITYISSGEIGFAFIGMKFVLQIVLGSLLGVLFAKLIIYTFSKANLNTQSLYSVFMVACVFFVYSATDAVGGNGYLAVYIAGLIVGNSQIVHRKSIMGFFDSFTWLWQIVMFLTLGLLVNPKELLEIAFFGLSVGIFMLLLGRPISVYLCLLPFKKITNNAKAYISWVGLRGAVPIIFATYPFAYEVPGAKIIFNTVFFITIVSLVIQGMSVISMAKILGLQSSIPQNDDDFGIEFPDEIKSSLSSIDLNAEMLKESDCLAGLKLPENTLVMLVKRDNKYFVPTGKTKLFEKDRLLFISDEGENLALHLENMGIEHFNAQKETSKNK